MNMGHKWQYPTHEERICTACKRQEISAIAAMELGHIGGSLWQEYAPGDEEVVCGTPRWVAALCFTVAGLVIGAGLAALLL